MKFGGEEERRNGFDAGDIRAEFHSKIVVLGELRATIRPATRTELFRSYVDPARSLPLPSTSTRTLVSA